MLVWIVVVPVLAVLTVVLGVPMALLFTVRRSRGGVLAVSGWIVAIWVGWLPAFAGPLGLPWPVAVASAAVFGSMFVWVFVRLAMLAWGRALDASRLVRSGVPPQEIV